MMMVVEVWKRQSQKDDDGGGLGFRGVFWEFDII